MKARHKFLQGMNIVKALHGISKTFVLSFLQNLYSLIPLSNPLIIGILLVFNPLFLFSISQPCTVYQKDIDCLYLI